MISSHAIHYYFAQTLTVLRRRHSLRSNAFILVLVALLNTAQGIACNLHDVTLAIHDSAKMSHVLQSGSEFPTGSVTDVSTDHPIDPTAPLDLEAHCLHISCVHSPAFPPSPIAHEFILALSAVPSSGTRLHWPVPPLGVHFRPPIQA